MKLLFVVHSYIKSLLFCCAGTVSSCNFPTHFLNISLHIVFIKKKKKILHAYSTNEETVTWADTEVLLPAALPIQIHFLEQVE